MADDGDGYNMGSHFIYAYNVLHSYNYAFIGLKHIGLPFNITFEYIQSLLCGRLKNKKCRINITWKFLI